MRPIPRAVNEFGLIERIRCRAVTDDSVLLGIGDDAAVMAPTPGQALVATTDSIVLDRHFTADWPAADIGHLALAVNLSDLAAMGASPRWTLLALTLPEADAAWVEGFLDGFLALAGEAGARLVGGNIACGPLNIGVQALGEAAPERIARRTGAQSGDCLAVTGTLGDAAAALAAGADAPADLLARLRRPRPRIEAGQQLAGLSHAMIDLSDGLLADLEHLRPGGLGARIELDRLPASAALKDRYAAGPERWSLQASGGSDYELLVALAPENLGPARAALARLGLELSEIGRLDDSGELACLDSNGDSVAMDKLGWDHFA